MATKYKTVIGRVEPIDFVMGSDEYSTVPAKIDTGAYSSSVWASSIREEAGELVFVLFSEGHPQYTGKEIRVKKYQTVHVENSFGNSEKRFGLMLRVRFCGKKVTTFFTLADRSQKIYSVLIGRKLLRGRYLVDVSQGSPVADEETEENLGYSGLKNRVRKTK